MKPENPDPGNDMTESDRQILSDAVDGELDAVSLVRGCRVWRDHAQARATWHTYHLIGDVLRSEDLASLPEHDDAFLRTVRGRMAAQPLPWVPESAASPASGVAGRGLPTAGRHRWLGPAAVAAGFMAVASVVWVSRMTAQPAGGAETLASTAAAATTPTTGLAPVAGTADASRDLVADPQLIRDARLDSYFEAHRSAFGANALAVPAGALRSVDTLLPQR
jgi:sigma-E factor negative regulatory protein RseA